MSDTINVNPETIERWGSMYVVPREPAESDNRWVKHVVCEGARFHVVSYSTNGPRCSEPKCIINKPR